MRDDGREEGVDGGNKHGVSDTGEKGDDQHYPGDVEGRDGQGDAGEYHQDGPAEITDYYDGASG